MTTLSAGAVADIPPGSRVFVDHKESRIAVFNVDGTLVAHRNHCPHHGAPVCTGVVSGTFEASDPQALAYGREGQILTCPWHHWQFDLATGACLTHDRSRLKTYPVTVERGEVLVHV